MKKITEEGKRSRRKRKRRRSRRRRRRWRKRFIFKRNSGKEPGNLLVVESDDEVLCGITACANTISQVIKELRVWVL